MEWLVESSPPQLAAQCATLSQASNPHSLQVLQVVLVGRPAAMLSLELLTGGGWPAADYRHIVDLVSAGWPRCSNCHAHPVESVSMCSDFESQYSGCLPELIQIPV